MFKLKSEYIPKGDQPAAIDRLVEGVNEGRKFQTLLGVTGSGKTFTIANVIEKVKKPVLVISHNKTLAAQLYGEFKEFFPENAVEYFVSYYDYYQPEAYIPQTDIYIEKDAAINDEIDRLRHSATSAVLTRRDCIIVASVSCIYGIGSPESYKSMHLHLKKGGTVNRDELARQLVDIQYVRNDTELFRGRFRMRGDTVEIFPSNADTVFRLEMFGDRIEKISAIDFLSGRTINIMDEAAIFPAQHWVTPRSQLEKAILGIRSELDDRLKDLHSKNKLVEAQRLEQKTNLDIEMLSEIGYCKGIENYSRHLDGRMSGQPPYTLVDYFPKDALFIIDESHVTLPQLRGMYRGDRSRKEILIEYGFRMPSALDNRPLFFEEFESRIPQMIYVSATPGDYEIKKSGRPVEQIIRPTGLIDPELAVKPVKSQVDDLIGEIKERVQREERVLVTTLTKQTAEDLAEYLKDAGIASRYLHSDIETLERIRIIQDLRRGKFSVLVGVNLLREGLDLPEVSMVAILDADKEGFLRSSRSLIQTIGRAARHIDGKVILYADVMTDSLKFAIRETERRRKIQSEFNAKNKITPESIKKSIRNILESVYEADYYTVPLVAEGEGEYIPADELPRVISELEKQMYVLAKNLEFEKAAEIRDRIQLLKKSGIAHRGAGILSEPSHGKSRIERKHRSRRMARARSLARRMGKRD